MKKNYYFGEGSIENENHENNVEVILNSTGIVLIDKKEEPEKIKDKIDEIPEIFIG